MRTSVLWWVGAALWIVGAVLLLFSSHNLALRMIALIFGMGGMGIAVTHKLWK